MIERIESQPGPQTEFLSSSADIVIYGGAAGGGKTFGLLMECLRHIDIPGFWSVLFRRTSTQVRNPGGLWDTSVTLFPLSGGYPRESALEWEFNGGNAKVKFAHMEYDKNRFDWQGSQIPFIGFDELTHFSWEQFVYMLSRNRSTCGVKPYIRATTNPDPDSWVRKIIDWWIGPEGYPIKERSGVVRWFITDNDALIWGDSCEELTAKFPDSIPKSLTFIPSSVHDNQILLSRDPGYLGNLKALPRFEREQLLMGNWNVRPTAGMFFQRSFFEVVDAVPANAYKVRYWDRAATKKTETNDPDYTVGVKLEKDSRGVFYVTDICRMQDSPLKVQNAIRNTASQDGTLCRVGIEQDPGQAGVSEVDLLVRMLAGFIVKPYKVQKDKITRASPVSAQAEAGNIKILKAKWNEDFFRELENFPDSLHDDQVDALSGAFLMHSENKYDITSFLDT